MIRVIFWAIIFSLFAILLETALLSNIYFLPVVPDLLLLVVLFISFNCGSMLGQTTGFISGFMLDFFSASPFGLNALLRTIIGFTAGFFKTSFNVDKYIFPCVIAFFATFAKAFFIWIISILYGDKIIAYTFFNNLFWVELVINVILSPVVFHFMSLFSSLFTLPLEDRKYEID